MSSWLVASASLNHRLHPSTKVIHRRRVSRRNNKSHSLLQTADEVIERVEVTEQIYTEATKQAIKQVSHI